ncbi:LysR family transcriptional regulator [Salinimonas sediminis]|uniref:LysR family transcriptional regulator n=1 Tax=Salinimonas sediminis TaxID=2303538 RepID=A0A346NHT6_9ALTE|nr:LysR family transcriptional regulator [Salinimonas sediminis]AXR05093.1 LysR family transcriptional regulator [Salinimonas sediminis]
MNIKLLRSLNVFVKVADAGNMSAAAKALHMTVSAISQQLRKLEMDIGLSLFNRNTRHLSLTEAGRIYYQSSVKMLDEAQRAHRHIEQLQESPSGELKITAPIGFGGGLLSAPLKRLTAQFPRIRVSLDLTDYPDDVISSGADLTLSLYETQDTNLTCIHLATWNWVMCAAADNPAAQVRHFSELGEYVHLAHEQMQTKTAVSQNQEHAVVPAPGMTVNSMQGLIQLTVDGLGYGILPEPEVRHFIAQGKLIQILPEWALPQYSVFAVFPRQDVTPSKTLAAVECLQHEFAQL